MSKNTNLSFLTDFLTADIVNSRVGMNNVSPQTTFDVTGTGKFSGILTLGSTISNGTYTYTLPSATGTLALVGGSGVGTVTSVAAITLGTSGTDLTSTVANGTTTPVITLNVPDASASARGVVTTGTQTLAGAKTFVSDIIVNDVNIGTGPNPTSISNFTNTRVGKFALSQNTTGFHNTAVGHGANQNNTTGNNNSALGLSALGQNTTGSQNTAVGIASLSSNISGLDNTGIGYLALDNSTTASDNTALGSEALRNITTGINNIGIGSDAGKVDVISGSANATSNSSIYIGNNSRPNSNGGSNEIVIGNNGAGSGSNTVTIGNSLTTENYFTGNIRGGAFIKTGGTSSQFLKADGSVDSSTYLTTASAASTYLPLTGGTLTGPLNGTSATFTGDLIAASATINTPANAVGVLVNGRTSDNFSQIRFGANTGGGAYNTIQASPTSFDIISQGNTPITFGTNLGSGGGTRMTIAGSGGVTLTGALNGTSASFTGAVTSDDLILTAGTLFGAGNTGFSNRLSDTTLYLQMPATGFNITDNALNTRFILASTGAATFSSSVTASLLKANDGVIQIFRAGSFRGGLYTLDAAIGSGTDYSATLTSEADINFLTGGSVTKKVTILAAGNVGIGTASPSQQLSVKNVDNNTQAIASFAANNLTQQVEIWYAGIRAGGTSTNVDLYLSSKNAGSIVCETNGTQKMLINLDGNVGIGVGSQGRKLAVVSGTNTPLFTHNTNNVSGVFGYISQLGGSNTNNTSSYYLYCDTDAVGVRMVIYGNGNLANVNNVYGAYSDIKLKENIEDATPKLDDLMKVKIRNYNLIGDDKKQIGVIAQELEEVFPAMIDESEDFEEVEVPQLDQEGNEILNEEGEVVTEKQRLSKGTSTKSVKYSVFVPMLIKAIQELKTEIDKLKNS